MKKKEIESLPWLVKGGNGKFVAKAVRKDLKGEDTLLIDYSFNSLPLLRVVLVKKDEANQAALYVPSESILIGNRRTWDCQPIYRSGWITTNIDNINFSAVTNKKRGERNCHYYGNSIAVMEDFLGKEVKQINNWYDKFTGCFPIANFQREIKFSVKAAREKAHCDAVKKKMDGFKKPPQAFFHWIENECSFRYGYFKPFKGREETECYCSLCGDVFSVTKKEAEKKQAKCPSCGKRLTIFRHDFEKPWKTQQYYSNYGLVTLPYKSHTTQVIYMDQLPDGRLAERHFEVNTCIFHDTEEMTVTERVRRILNPDGSTEKFFNHEGWSNGTYDEWWYDRNVAYTMHTIPTINGPVYFPSVKKLAKSEKYRYSGLYECANAGEKFSVLDYLANYREMPQMEILAKVGLTNLALNIKSTNFDVSKTKIWEALRITKQDYNWIRGINGSHLVLEWLQFLAQDTRLTKRDYADIAYLAEQGIYPYRLSSFRTKEEDGYHYLISLKKAVNYIKKQTIATGHSASGVVGDWVDYVDMAKADGMDITRSSVLMPKDVFEAHDELANKEYCNDRGKQIAERLPQVEPVLQSLSRYGYTDGTYTIVIPQTIAEIVMEGKKLGHCLDRTDLYFNRIVNRESYIAFLRKNDAISKPWYTVEFEPGGSIRQKRTYGDRQDPDLAEAKLFLFKWQQQIKSKLTEEDMSLQDISRRLRDEEFAELLMNQTKIRNGVLQGQLLVDVLKADLMEAV